MAFDPYNPEDLSSEEVFDKAIAAFGGMRPAAVFGQNPNHKNADWIIPDKKFVIEHKQLEATFTDSEAFRSSELELRLRYAREKKATIFGVVHASARHEFSLEYVNLLRKPFARIIKSANRQIRETRSRLGWPKGQGVLVLSNKNLLDVIPLGICILVESILGGAYSEIGGVVYTTNHYVDVPGSNLAHSLWLPIYKQGGEQTPVHIVEFIDDFGRAVLPQMWSGAPDFVKSEYSAGSPDALRALQARPIHRR
jgi:hypothetical protein